MYYSSILILGAGISGIGTAYSLRQKGNTPILIERDDTYGKQSKNGY